MKGNVAKVDTQHYYIKKNETCPYVQVDLKSFEQIFPFFPGHGVPVWNKKLWTGWSPHASEPVKTSISVNEPGS